jgi:hypothetical protein
MSYKAYIDNIQAKTGKGPEYYLSEAKKKGLTTHKELLDWLKSDCGLGHGHANAIILYIQNPDIAKKKILMDTKKEKRNKKE